MSARIMRRMTTIERLEGWLRTGSARYLLLPALAAAGIAITVSGYAPLVFEQSQAQAQPSAAIGAMLDAEELEAEALASEPTPVVQEAAALAADAQLADGTYTGFAPCTEEDVFDYYLAVDVTVKGGKVAGISNVRGSSTGNKGDARKAAYDPINDPYLDWAAYGRQLGGTSFQGVVPQILGDAARGSISTSVDAVSGATYSSRSLLSAYLDALTKAAAAAGAELEEAEEAAKQEAAAVEEAAGGEGAESGDSIEPNVNVAGTLLDGTYTAYAFCADLDDPSAYGAYYIGATVTVAGGAVSSLEFFGDKEGVVDPAYLYDAAENLFYFDRAVKGFGLSGKNPGVATQINSMLSAGEQSAYVDTVSGATWSSRSMIEAFNAAVELARAPEAAGEDMPAEGPSESEAESQDEGALRPEEAAKPEPAEEVAA